MKIVVDLLFTITKTVFDVNFRWSSSENRARKKVKNKMRHHHVFSSFISTLALDQSAPKKSLSYCKKLNSIRWAVYHLLTNTHWAIYYLSFTCWKRSVSGLLFGKVLSIERVIMIWKIIEMLPSEDNTLLHIHNSSDNTQSQAIE